MNSVTSISMENNKDSWWDKKVTRVVDQLKLWSQNPRIDPSESHITTSDYAEAFTETDTDKKKFLSLVKSIVSKGFLSFEPVVVWKDDKGKHIVAEGNRRVLALKLLRHPEKAPRSIRRFIKEQSELIDRDSIEKIKVCLAPNFDECEWYILQRHSTSSLQVSWERLQQQRWVESVCDKYDNDLELIKDKTGFQKAEIEKTLRYLKIRDLATRQEVTSQMSVDEREIIYGPRMPMTIIERWFDSFDVREAWGLSYKGSDIELVSNEKSFLYAYAKLLKWIFDSVEFSDYTHKPNTRTIPEKNEYFLDILPKVSFEKNEETNDNNSAKNDSNKEKEDEPKIKVDLKGSKKERQKILNKNPDRNQMVGKYWKINVSSSKLSAIFNEFKKLPVERYKNTTAATLRVFLDLAVDEYIGCENLKSDITREYKNSYNKITLKERLKFIVDTQIKDAEANKVIGKLLHNENEHSLDTLNNYIHGTDTHKVNKRFINGFWDMMTPLFAVLISLKEE